MALAKAHSGIQREALALYRRPVFLCALEAKLTLRFRALRMVRTKPPSAQRNFLALVRSHFRTQAHAVSPRNVSAVEHLMRRSQRMLDGWESATVRDVALTDDMARAGTGRRAH